MKQCPRCASEITKNDKVCPRCKLPVDKMKFNESLYEDDEKSDHKYEVSEVGSYQVQIGNQKGDITRWIYSSECIVPAAAQPVIKT